jgi:hypothetical protein
MFGGEERAWLPANGPDEAIVERVEDALRDLGRVRINKRGDITIEPRAYLGSFLTDVVINGHLYFREDGFELTLWYDCNPSTATWVLAAVLLFTTCLGALIFLAPMTEKDKVRRALRDTLMDLEDSLEAKRP